MRRGNPTIMKFKIRSKTNNKKFIYGNVRHNKKANTLIIIMSGYTGSENFRLNTRTAKYFYKQDFSVLRFNFCNERKNIHRIDALQLAEVDFNIYKIELKNIIDHFDQHYSQIILIGHSFGAVVSILFLEKFKNYRKKIKLILWDQSLLPWSQQIMEDEFTLDKKNKIYTEKGTGLKLNVKFYRSLIKTDTLKIFSQLEIPTCIIAAEHSGDSDAKKYFAKIKNKNGSEIHIIKNTGHLFEEQKAQTQLFSITKNFIHNQ